VVLSINNALHVEHELVSARSFPPIQLESLSSTEQTTDDTPSARQTTWRRLPQSHTGSLKHDDINCNPITTRIITTAHKADWSNLYNSTDTYKPSLRKPNILCRHLETTVQVSITTFWCVWNKSTILVEQETTPILVNYYYYVCGCCWSTVSTSADHTRRSRVKPVLYNRRERQHPNIPASM